MSWSLVPGSERVGRSLDALTKKTTGSSKCHSGLHTTEPFKITLTHMITIHNQSMNTIFFQISFYLLIQELAVDF